MSSADGNNVDDQQGDDDLDDLPAPRRLGAAKFTTTPEAKAETPTVPRPRIPERTAPAAHLSAVPVTEEPESSPTRKKKTSKSVGEKATPAAPSSTRYGFVGVSVMFTLTDLAWFESEVDQDASRSQRSVLLGLCAAHDGDVEPGPTTGRAALGLDPGRPPARTGERTVAVKVSMKEDERDVLDERAERRNLSRSAYVADLIRAAKAAS